MGGIIKSLDINFDRAYPEKIKTDLPALTISYSNQTITLTTKLTRSTGRPSLFSSAKIYAIDSLGNSVGQFLNYSESVDENGLLLNQFSLGTTSCNCQNVLIVSETKNSQNSFIRDTTTLKIN